MINHTIHAFPSEAVSNEVKKSFNFAKEYASAIWSEWESKVITRNKKIKELREYANGEQDISHCKKNIVRNYIKADMLHIDWQDKLNLLPIVLRSFYNSVDMDELTPVVKAIDPSALAFKDKRKKEKLELFYAKDFIQMASELAGGESPIPLENIPQSKEQIELEEETAHPLKIETAEELVIEAVARQNAFHLIQKDILEEMVVTNYGIGKVSTCPINGVKMELVKIENFIHGKSSNRYFSDCPYYGEVRNISVGQFKNIAKESGLSFSDEEIKKMASISQLTELTNSTQIKVLCYAFKTYFQNVYKKKINRKTKAVSLIDRTQDVGTEREYKPKYESDKSEKIVDNYEVWFEGIMVLDENKTIIKHKLMNNMPEHQGNILPPYIVVCPRHKSIVEEVIPRINAIQELRYRILHYRNSLKGNLTEIDPDMIANITLGNEKLSPKEVLSMYFTMGLAFRKTKDEDGEFVNNNRPLQEIDPGIPRALIQLSQEFISEIQLFNQSFGAIQYEQASPNPKSLTEFEPYRFSSNTAMRDYINYLYQWSINCYQSVSSRINDAFEWKHIREKFINAIGSDDVEVIEEFRKNRGNHYFGIYVDYIPTAEERTNLQKRLEQYVMNGLLDPLDEMEISGVKNRKKALSMLRLRIIAKQQEMQQAEMQKHENQINANAQSAIIAQEEKRKTMQLEFQLKAEADAIEFERKAFLLQKQGEISITQEQIRSEAKVTAQQWSSQFATDLAKFKKDEERKTKMISNDQNAHNQEQLIKLRKGIIDKIEPYQESNEENILENVPPQQEIDLSQLQ